MFEYATTPVDQVIQVVRNTILIESGGKRVWLPSFVMRDPTRVPAAGEPLEIQKRWAEQQGLAPAAGPDAGEPAPTP